MYKRQVLLQQPGDACRGSSHRILKMVARRELKQGLNPPGPADVRYFLRILLHRSHTGVSGPVSYTHLDVYKRQAAATYVAAAAFAADKLMPAGGYDDLPAIIASDGVFENTIHGHTSPLFFAPARLRCV